MINPVSSRIVCRALTLAALTLVGVDGWAQEPTLAQVPNAAEPSGDAAAGTAAAEDPGAGLPASPPSPSAAPPAPVATPQVDIQVEFPGGSSAAVGQPVRVVVSLAPPDGFALVGVDVSGNRFVETLSEDVPTVLSDGRTQFGLSLGVFRSGSFSADGIEAVLIDETGQQHRVISAPFTLEITSSIVNESDPQPAASDGPLTVLTRDMRPLYAGVALGFVLLGFLIAALWRRAKAGYVEPEPEPSRPSWEVAFEALDRLEAEGLVEAGEHLSFHMRLSEILRVYLGERFTFYAPEMTTHEIATWLHRHEAEAGGYRDEIIDVLSEMDVVKFARFTPPAELSEQCLASVRTLVTELSAREREQLAQAEAEESQQGEGAAEGAAEAAAEGAAVLPSGARSSVASRVRGGSREGSAAEAAPARAVEGEAAASTASEAAASSAESGARSSVEAAAAGVAAAPEDDAPARPSGDAPARPSNVVPWKPRAGEDE